MKLIKEQKMPPDASGPQRSGRVDGRFLLERFKLAPVWFCQLLLWDIKSHGQTLHTKDDVKREKNLISGLHTNREVFPQKSDLRFCLCVDERPNI